MRIPLTVESLYVERKGAYATFFLQIPSMRVARPVSAVVDTGSPFTSISPKDAVAFGLPISHWGKGEVVFLAGFKFFRHTLEATLTFKDEEKKLVRFRQAVIVLVPTKMDRDSLAEMQAIPSLVGTDLMEDHDLTFVFEPHKPEAYFEKPDAAPTPTTAPQPSPVMASEERVEVSEEPKAEMMAKVTPIALKKRVLMLLEEATRV